MPWVVMWPSALEGRSATSDALRVAVALTANKHCAEPHFETWCSLPWVRQSRTLEKKSWRPREAGI